MNLTRVLYHLTADYHSGQWSRGYRLLCRCQRRLKRNQRFPSVYWECLSMGVEERRLYDELATRYRDKL